VGGYGRPRPSGADDGLRTHTIAVSKEGTSSVNHATIFPRGQIRASTGRIAAHVGAWALGELADRRG